MFPQLAAWTRRSSAAPSLAANRSRSSTRARGCGGRRNTARRTSPPSARRWTDSPVEAVVIHAVYLINCATKDKELRKKSLASLTHALRIGDEIGAAGVVLHPGAQKGEPLGPSMKRAAKVIAAALEGQRQLSPAARADRRPQGPAGPRLRPDRRADRAGGRRQAPRPLPRLLPPLRAGLRHHRRRPPCRGRSTRPTRRSAWSACAASTSTTPPPRSAPAATATPTSARARWANEGLAAFLSEPRFEGLPATLETPGPNKKGADRKEVQAAKRLRQGRPQTTPALAARLTNLHLGVPGAPKCSFDAETSSPAI